MIRGQAPPWAPEAHPHLGRGRGDGCQYLSGHLTCRVRGLGDTKSCRLGLVSVGTLGRTAAGAACWMVLGGGLTDT